MSDGVWISLISQCKRRSRWGRTSRVRGDRLAALQTAVLRASAEEKVPPAAEVSLQSARGQGCWQGALAVPASLGRATQICTPVLERVGRHGLVGDARRPWAGFGRVGGRGRQASGGMHPPGRCIHR
jgi:hypothetical protein